MRPGKFNQGITLVELLIATVIVGIIMLGVVSSDYAIRKQANYAAISAIASINAQSIINHILYNASLAIGSSTDKGILIGAEIGPGVQASSFCSRKVIGPPESWVCYTVLAPSLYTCVKPSKGECSVSDTNLGGIASMSPIFTLNNAQGSQMIRFLITVTVLDASSATGFRSIYAGITPWQHTN